MDLDSNRREYRFGILDRNLLDDSPFNQFNTWMDNALAADIPDPTAMTVTTVSQTGIPWSRIVLLKGFSSAGFVFYTNLKSQKAKEIEATPVVTLHFPWLQMDRQVITSGTASRLPVATSQAYFATRPRESQLAAWASHQSSVIPSRQTLDDEYLAAESRFAGKDVPMPDFWGGFVVVPDVFEFWQGGEKRLHDRFRYTREVGDHWRIERLSP